MDEVLRFCALEDGFLVLPFAATAESPLHAVLQDTVNAMVVVVIHAVQASGLVLLFLQTRPQPVKVPHQSILARQRQCLDSLRQHHNRNKLTVR